MYRYGNLQSGNQLGPETEVELSWSSSKVFVVDAIADSGACITCIPKRYIDRIGSRAYGRQRVRGAFGSSMYMKTFFVDIKIGEHEFEALEVLAIENKVYALIGRDILNQRKITLRGRLGQWSIDLDEENEDS